MRTARRADTDPVAVRLRRGFLFAVAALVVGLAAGCGVRTEDGQCKDYEPVGCWKSGYEEVCRQTKDGCRQCTCVRNAHERAGEDPGAAMD
ncbi:MAG: hypothetical protein ABEL76_01910 [Bradymonadaceae bacterium]